MDSVLEDDILQDILGNKEETPCGPVDSALQTLSDSELTWEKLLPDY